ADIKVLGLLDHPNIVKIIGYCIEEDHYRLLVCEYMDRGCLGRLLLGRTRTKYYEDRLPWSIRLKVAVGFAKGLAYLHSLENWNAKLCMTWLAKSGLLDADSCVSLQVRSTSGYAAPEYFATGDLTTASNIYTFGVVLLEILTWRQCIDKNLPLSEQILAESVKRNLSRKQRIQLIIDPNIDGQYSPDLATRAVKLAMKCLLEEPKQRPTASDVVRELEELQD
nr:receptor-like cytoplasmic kinase 176 [Tanacetum cinerariifolium]